MSERLNVPHWINDEIKRAMKSESYFEKRNAAFEEMNAILDANGDNPDDPSYREAFKRWQEIALGGA